MVAESFFHFQALVFNELPWFVAERECENLLELAIKTCCKIYLDYLA